MEIRAKCIKRLFTDTLCVDKGETVTVKERECSWQVHEPFYARCDYDDDYEPFRVPDIHYYKRYEVENRWIKVTLFGDKESAHRYKGLLFSDYFEKEIIELTVENVDKLFDECAAKKVANKFDRDTLHFNGIVHTHSYNMIKIEEHKMEILDMLHQLPKTFFKSSGGGWSFLNMCMRQDNVQWTGLHSEVEKLLTMGMAAGYISYLIPEKLWHILPGDMPYIVINDETL